MFLFSFIYGLVNGYLGHRAYRRAYEKGLATARR